jgi:hypothetical protein
MRENKYANDTPETDFRCTKTARFRVGDDNFCSSHAGMAALNLLMMIERYPPPSPKTLNKTHIAYENPHGFTAPLCRMNMQYTQDPKMVSEAEFRTTVKKNRCKICEGRLHRKGAE